MFSLFESCLAVFIQYHEGDALLIFVETLEHLAAKCFLPLTNVVVGRAKVQQGGSGNGVGAGNLEPSTSEAQQQQLTWKITCPASAKAGDSIQIAGPSGQRVQVVVPAGINPGDQFMVEMDHDASMKRRTQRKELEILARSFGSLESIAGVLNRSIIGRINCRTTLNNFLVLLRPCPVMLREIPAPILMMGCVLMPIALLPFL